MSLCPLPPPSPLHNVPEGVLAGQLLSVLEAVHILRPVIGSALHSKLVRDCTITSPLCASLLGHDARVCASLKSLVTALVTGEADSSDDDAPGELQSPSVVWAATEEKLQEKVVAACGDDDEAADVSDDQKNAAASMATNSGFLSAALIRAARVGGPGWFSALAPGLKVECLHFLCNEALDSDAFRQSMTSAPDADAKERTRVKLAACKALTAAQAAVKLAHMQAIALSGPPPQGCSMFETMQHRGKASKAKADALAAEMAVKTCQAELAAAQQADKDGKDGVVAAAKAAAAAHRTGHLGMDCFGRRYWRMHCLEASHLLGVSWSTATNATKLSWCAPCDDNSAEFWGTYSVSQAQAAADSVGDAALRHDLLQWAKQHRAAQAAK
jgi:WSTF, HB1, Itc1p, MBD9 motif 1